MPAGHAPFAIWNRTGNRLVAGLLRSPLHPIMGRRTALITVRGRRSGRDVTLPVSYRRDGDQVTIHVLMANRKLWWRNLRGGAPVRLRMDGRERTGQARLRGDPGSELLVDVTLDPGS